MVLSIKATRSLGYGGVQAVQVVRRPDQQNPVVGTQAVQLVEEVASCIIPNETVQIFQDQQAGRCPPSLLENLLNRPLRSRAGVQGFDVQRRDWWRALGEGVDDCFGGEGFAVFWDSVEDDASFPRDFGYLVQCSVVEEAVDVLVQFSSEAGVDDDIFPTGFLYALLESFALDPLCVIEHPDLFVDTARPFARSEKHFIGYWMVPGVDIRW